MENQLIRFEEFKPLTGCSFKICAAGTSHFVDARLREVELLGAGNANKGDDRSPFSLLFEVAEQQVMIQGLYNLQCSAGNWSNIFLVPVTAGGDGWRLEAVFN